MNPTFVIIALAILTIALVFLFFNRSGNNARASRTARMPAGNSQAAKTTTQWRSVKIEPGLFRCSAVEALSGRIFLSTDSPPIPLAECGEAECRCKYIHLEDRRSGEERRLELGDLGAFLPTNPIERRQRNGRRESDLAA